MKHITLFTTILSLLFITSVSHAALISELSSRDYLTVGDGLITYDSSTGLEWLDLTLTRGNSIVDTEASTYFADFRWATNTEIEDILDAAILGTGYRDSTAGADVANATAFIALFATSDQSQDRRIAHGTSRGAPYLLDPRDIYGLGYVQIARIPSGLIRAQAEDPMSNCCWFADTSDARVGSWLVRSSVPAPPTITLLGLGLLGLAATRRKQMKI